MSLLPVGSIVKYKQGFFMVAGFGVISEDIFYKYALLPYPFGNTFGGDMLLTNEDFEEIDYEGYQDDDHEGMEQLLEVLYQQFKKEHSSQDSVDFNEIENSAFDE